MHIYKMRLKFGSRVQLNVSWMLSVILASLRIWSEALMRLIELLRLPEQFPRSPHQQADYGHKPHTGSDQHQINTPDGSGSLHFDHLLGRDALGARPGDLEFRNGGAHLVRTLHEAFHLDERAVAGSVPLGYKGALCEHSQADVAVVQHFKVLGYLLFGWFRIGGHLQVLRPARRISEQGYFDGQCPADGDVRPHSGHSVTWF